MSITIRTRINMNTYYTNVSSLMTKKKPNYCTTYNVKKGIFSISQLEPNWHPVGSTMVNKIIVSEIPSTVTIYDTNNNGRSRRHNSHTTPTLPNSAGSLTPNTNSNANTTAGTPLDYVYSDSSEESSDGISTNKENGVHPDWDRYYRELVDGSLQFF